MQVSPIVHVSRIRDFPEAGLHRDGFAFEDVDILSRYAAYPASESSFREQTSQQICTPQFFHGLLNTTSGRSLVSQSIGIV